MIPTSTFAISKEYEVKAAFIYNFTKFVKWPEKDFGTTDAPIVIGYIENNPFGKVMEKTLNGRTLHNRPFVYRKVRNTEEAKQVHVLFISLDNSTNNRTLLNELELVPVLTIAEDEGFNQDGGIIEFFIEEGKVRFNLNITSAKKTGLSISARLQALAKKIH